MSRRYSGFSNYLAHHNDNFLGKFVSPKANHEYYNALFIYADEYLQKFDMYYVRINNIRKHGEHNYLGAQPLNDL